MGHVESTFLSHAEEATLDIGETWRRSKDPMVLQVLISLLLHSGFLSAGLAA